MSIQEDNTIFRKNYRPYPFAVDSIRLRLELDARETRVYSCMEIHRTSGNGGEALQLNGEHLRLLSVRLDGRRLGEDDYRYDGRLLTIETVPERFRLEVETCIDPQANTALEGLYLSSGNFCTQCEAEGFRRITCFPDRPDVLTRFTTTIVADRDACPVLLSNGNLVEQGDLEGRRHFATWEDPFPKPCYLFALVAGDLVRIEDRFTTMSGREVDLHIYVQARNRNRCDHAMKSLKKAMRWDEEVFGLEYDLDTYMIVAVDDFNMGAMENKGLNIFNSRYVLARPETATDADYTHIEGVIAHEYFHNWTGNRITCRDWFQLSLKEGLTVFRDQEFSADMGSRPVKRIQDVNLIRSYQFREDSGPMAHPVRPDSYREINNFYTLTVYNKGAEVIRMLHTLLGREGFRRGMDIYIQRHDGQAVTCDDFLQAMEDATGSDLSRFRLWYSQAGTPRLQVRETYDSGQGVYRLRLRQSCPPTPGQPEKEPFVLPIRVGLLDGRGQDLVDELIVLSEEEAEYSWQEIGEKPVLSLLRDFSAPVRVERSCSEEELAFLLAHDRDPFNRWDSGQRLALGHILRQIDHWRQSGQVQVEELFLRTCKQVLHDDQSDPAFLALLLTLPTENWIAEQMEEIDPEAVFVVRQSLCHRIGVALRNHFLERYTSLDSGEPYRFTSQEVGRRALRNCCLAYLLAAEPGKPVDTEMLELGLAQYGGADNMTDSMAALTAVVNADRARGDSLLAEFYHRWQDDPLVVDKWFTLQATCGLDGTLERVMELTSHPAFTLQNPNRVRALIGAFCTGNPARFHERSGRGYRFLADHVLELDRLNPQIAARLLTPLTSWKRYDRGRRQLMRAELERIAGREKLSADVREIVEKSLV